MIFTVSKVYVDGLAHERPVALPKSKTTDRFVLHSVEVDSLAERVTLRFTLVEGTADEGPRTLHLTLNAASKKSNEKAAYDAFLAYPGLVAALYDAAMTAGQTTGFVAPAEEVRDDLGGLER